MFAYMRADKQKRALPEPEGDERSAKRARHDTCTPCERRAMAIKERERLEDATVEQLVARVDTWARAIQKNAGEGDRGSQFDRIKSDWRPSPPYGWQPDPLVLD